MLKETLKKDEIAAMKARDKAKVNVLRLVNAEIKAYEVNNREETVKMTNYSKHKEMDC